MRYITGKLKPNLKKQDNGEPSSNIPSPDRNSAGNHVSEDAFRSEVFPDDSPLHRPVIARRIGFVLVLLALSASSWFCFLGPGAAYLEANLRELAVKASVPPVFTFTPSETPPQTPERAGDKSILILDTTTPTLTIVPSLTSTHTPTATFTLEPSPTPIPVEITSTPTSEEPGCVPASQVTLADVGKNFCISGRVQRIIDKPSSLIIILVEDPLAFYFVAYDLRYDDLEKKCIYATGEIRQLGNNPIMVLSYSTPLQYCSESSND